MSQLLQTPPPGARLAHCAGDLVEFTLRLPSPRAGRALLRTNLGRGEARLAEIIAHTERQKPFHASDWHDIPMIDEGEGRFRLRMPLLDVGWFAAKTCFIPRGSQAPEWPEGENCRLKVSPASGARANSIYTAFVRQFRPTERAGEENEEDIRQAERRLDACGYHAIPPSGTFRDLIRRLDHIVGTLGCRILQLLPIHPTPTSYARMGRFGSPFAALDFMAVDPALAEFDRRTTPLDQFRELADAVHARGAGLFLDIPANHTGWASTLQTHHPEWFQRTHDGHFTSPGAWGTVWEDLVALDYREPALRTYMAEVFLFWCRQGADGFRCDAGYMIPAATWTYIVARVRREYPDTLFLLEGLGGKVEVTEQLLTESNLDWAYSELFQVGPAREVERYSRDLLPLSTHAGPLVHFAETHDNHRLAASGPRHARLRTALTALLSQRGAFGITNGLEWLATEKLDVHGAPSLNWDASPNLVSWIARLNALLALHPAFAEARPPQWLPHQGTDNTLAFLRQGSDKSRLLVAANLDCHRSGWVAWPAEVFNSASVLDLLTGRKKQPHPLSPNRLRMELTPGEICCLGDDPTFLPRLREAETSRSSEPTDLHRRRSNLLALRLRRHLTGAHALSGDEAPDPLGASMTLDPRAFAASLMPHGGPAPLTSWTWETDRRRVVLLPRGNLLLVRAPHPFRASLECDHRTVASERSLSFADGSQGTLLLPAEGRLPKAASRAIELRLSLVVYTPENVVRTPGRLLLLPDGRDPRVRLRVGGARLRTAPYAALLTNGMGAMARVRGAWGTIQSQYDALLAANLNPRQPDNRRIFFTRCRAWLRYRGYSHALDANCTEWFEADPGGTRATWHFNVPAGMGRHVRLEFSLRMTRGRNRVTLNVTRLSAADAPDALADHEAVGIVLRPDIEARNFHEKTSAQTAPANAFHQAMQNGPSGFDFAPTRDEQYRIAVDVGAYHPDPLWLTQVPHPEEAGRGLGASSDLFSPGWFRIDLQAGQRSHLVAEALTDPPASVTEAVTVNPSTPRLPLPDVLTRALDAFVVKRDDLLTVIAGYPWFLDWGRDTLIVLRGMIAAGRAEETLEILREFGRLEQQGTLPNMIRGDDASNRDTSDAPLWFAVATFDAIRSLGLDTVLEADCGGRPLARVLISIARHYRDGTPNGIHTDPESGLIFSPSHFTWMDTNFPAGTPREGYPVEIQSLWIHMLTGLRKYLAMEEFGTIEQHARDSLARLYPQPEGWLADNLQAAPGTRAAEAQPEDALRPNQLLAIALEAIELDAAPAILRACETLLVPGAIRSLADRPVKRPQPIAGPDGLLNDPLHPYWGHYQGDENTRRKPAYHNGTAWVWPFPLYGEALLKIHGASAKPLVRSLLTSIVPLLEEGCVGQAPEILDGDAPHRQRGCDAQAWSLSETLRVWLMCDAL